MKIGIDARMYSTKFTGIGRYVYELIQNLQEIDKKNEYFIFLNDPEYKTYIPTNPNFHKIRVNARHYTLTEQLKFLRKLNKCKLDLVHFTHFNAPILYFKPSIVTIHDLTLSFYPGKKMTSVFHRIAYHLTIYCSIKKAKKIIAVSQNTKKDIEKLFKINSEKIKVIYEAANKDFKPIKDQKLLDHIKEKYDLDKPFLLYTGVWRDHKNITGLLKGFHILQQKYKFNGYLVITGKEDPHYPEVKETVKTYNLQKHVKFTGLIPEQDLIALYNLAEIYVLPSFYEGFGLPILEAFACNTPVACSDSSSLPEIAGEQNAIFFDPKDHEDIAAKIHQILKDKSLRKTLKSRGQKRLTRFSWPKMAKETLEVYNS
ncbi:MAG: mannosyltransferase B-like protein [Candidatus Peregrinibacteria bacterium GW2011_GWA2_33_10]|nr:MAG: mannosyltransferase B-like protein [Candidatus Peregrinibacteria bacterium GW2011_GWA2_33_10]KKP40975.1 MAG: group 1 glycosyl transferase [Candidatus Peregrinibacteria bacterium GW2011_GWC2_33_13]